MLQHTVPTKMAEADIVVAMTSMWPQNRLTVHWIN